MKDQTIQYNGYTALLTYDPEDESYTGEVIGIEDMIVFEGSTIEEALENFKDMMERYPKLCSKMNFEPNPPPEQIMVPVEPELYAKAVSIAETNGQTTTGVVNQAIEALVAQY
jgi:predicted HicB family RNase H-like nuclease